VARLGGDEFGILIDDDSSKVTVLEVAERALRAVAAPLNVHGRDINVTGSIGIARTSDLLHSSEHLLRGADVAMYVAKEAGGNGIQTFELRMHQAVVDRLELESDLANAVADGQLTVEYQPVVDLQSNRVLGFEALARWNHPTHGMVAPAEFITVAESTGAIHEIGNFVLARACENVRAWQQEAGDSDLSVAVNVSVVQLNDPAFVNSVRSVLEATAIEPSCLTLEITESVFMTDPETLLVRLRALSELGVRLALDDFGTGYSSLGYLRHLPIDVLKIDKVFVDPLAFDGENAELARAIVRISQTLHMDTVAEGIESEAQAQRLRDLGCTRGQGFLYSRPLSPDAARNMLLHPDVLVENSHDDSQYAHVAAQ
jgi:predicted signal transduction protein with EAL and GGDEF domain